MKNLNHTMNVEDVYASGGERGRVRLTRPPAGTNNLELVAQEKNNIVMQNVLLDNTDAKEIDHFFSSASSVMEPESSSFQSTKKQTSCDKGEMACANPSSLSITADKAIQKNIYNII